MAFNPSSQWETGAGKVSFWWLHHGAKKAFRNVSSRQQRFKPCCFLPCMYSPKWYLLRLRT